MKGSKPKDERIAILVLSREILAAYCKGQQKYT
jgi:hypothetical protein